jgi:hypothetical protein
VRIAKKHCLQATDVLLGFLCGYFLIYCADGTLLTSSLLGRIYLVTQGVAVVPKSVHAERIQLNYVGAMAAAKVLDPDEIEELQGLAAKGKQKRSVFRN